MAIRRARLKMQQRARSRLSLPCVLRAKAKPGLGSRPACTRSASAMPSSWNTACRPRLLSKATCTASSIDSGLASSSRTRWSMRSRSASERAQLHVLAEAILGGLLHRCEAAVRAEGGAAAEHAGCCQHGQRLPAWPASARGSVWRRAWRYSWRLVPGVALWRGHGHGFGLVLASARGLGRGDSRRGAGGRR